MSSHQPSSQSAHLSGGTKTVRAQGSAARRTNLPIPLTRFIGRERECDEVRRLLPATRLLTLTGSGGCGKTRLALQVAARLESFPDGIWLIDLAPLADAALVPQTVAAVFDLHESTVPPANVLQTFLQGKQMLWVLDNCEHVVQTCAEFADTLLRSCPDLKILGTSREPLNIAAETTFRVPSLALPELEPLPSLEDLSHCESIRLFIERAQAGRPELELTDRNARVIAQICHRLDGMPLAIELAAARVSSFSIEEIAARLDDRFRWLRSGPRTTLPRYQTLRASIDWSYDLLADAERALLRRLAVFAGGFTLEAAESVCGEGLEEFPDVMSRLVQKSLVVAKLDDRPRYRLLETIRQYAREKLAESTEGLAIRERHLSYFVAWAERVTPQLLAPEQAQALERLDGENDNLRAALEWSLREGRVEKGLRLAAALAWFWERRGYWSEGRERLERLLEQPEAQGPTLVRARALVAVGLLANSAAEAWVGGARVSRPFLEQAIGIARGNSPEGQRLCALALALLSNNVRLENPALAQSQYDEAWRIVQEFNEPWVSALLLHQRGHWYDKQEDYRSAGKAFQESMELFRSVGDRRWEAILWGDIAHFVYVLRGDREKAREINTRNLAYFRETRDRMFICFSLSGLGEIARLEGKRDLAQEYYDEAIRIARELGSKLLTGGAAYCLGFLAAQAGEFELARAYFSESLVIMRELKADARLAHVLAGLGILAVEQKNMSRAACLFGAVNTLLAGRTLRNLNLANEVDYDRYLDLTREQLGPAFRAAWMQGCSMSREQAIEFALAEPKADAPAEGPAGKRKEFGGLSPREEQVALLIGQGKSNLEIAAALVVSERTVTTHVSHILSKLGFTSRTQIAAWVTAKRLTQS